MIYVACIKRVAVWHAGENEVDVWARRAAPVPCHDATKQHPRDFPRQVVWVRPAGEPHDPVDRDLYDLVELDITEAEAAGMRAGIYKVPAGLKTVADVTFDDLHGATASDLRRLFPDAGTDEEEREQAAIEAVIENNRMLDLAYEVELREWKERTAKAILAAIPGDETLKEPKPLRPSHQPIPEPAFSQAADRLQRALPKTKTHTGTGLYAVKVAPASQSDRISNVANNGDGTWTITFGVSPSFDSSWLGGYFSNTTRSQVRAITEVVDFESVKVEGDCSTWEIADEGTIYDAWSTIQAAHDQLYTDQGSANFTAEQEIRGYAGTYVAPQIVLNVSMRPLEVYPLRISANTGDSVTLQSTGSVLHMSGVDNVVVENFTLTCAGVNNWCLCALGYGCIVSGCTFNGTGSYGLYNNVNSLLVEDCSFASTLDIYAAWLYDSSIFRRCRFELRAYCYRGGHSIRFESCTFDGAYVQTYSDNDESAAMLGIAFVHCTFYNAEWAVRSAASSVPPHISIYARNNIFHTITNEVFGHASETTVFRRVDSERNVFYNCAAISASYPALTDWQDMTDEAGNSPDAASFEADPKLTDAPGGDFSLLAGSPCSRRGIGAGVTEDVDGNPLCQHHPDIGSSSTGTSTAAPGISTVVPSASSIVVTVTAGGGPREVAVIVDKTGTEIDRQSRLGAGDITLTPSASGKHYLAVYPANAGDTVIGEADVWHRAVVVPSATETEWKQAVAAIAAELDDYTSIKVIIPNQRFNPAAETEFIEIDRPRFQGGGGRRGERLTRVSVGVWCTAKVGGDERNLGRALEIADVVEGALGEADIEIESGKWLRFEKAAVTSEGEAEHQGAMLQVARVEIEGTYQRS